MNILVVDDHPLARLGLSSSLAHVTNIENIYEASNVSGAIKLLSHNDIDMTLIDLNLGNEYGLEIVKEAQRLKISSKFVVLTSSGKISDFTKARELGVEGYLLKDALVEDIIYAIRVVARGKPFYDSELVNCNFKQKENDISQLTARERDVLVEIGKGLSNIEIASKLLISEFTVKKHVSNILGKLNLTHRTEAALYINNIDTM